MFTNTKNFIKIRLELRYDDYDNQSDDSFQWGIVGIPLGIIIMTKVYLEKREKPQSMYRRQKSEDTTNKNETSTRWQWILIK